MTNDKGLDERDVKKIVRVMIDQARRDALYTTKNVASHTHNGLDSPLINTGTTSIGGRSHGTATTSIPGGFTVTKIDYNANDSAMGITWDGTNHRFTCLTAGNYIVTASVGYNGSQSGNQYEIAIYQNGSQGGTARQHSAVNGSVLNINVTDRVILVVGDYIEAKTQHGDAGAISILNSTLYTYLDISKV